MYTEKLINFIKSSPSAFHTVETVTKALIKEGYTELSDGESAAFSDGGKHFVTRGGTSLVAFKGKSEQGGFMICASHSDFPAFKIKDAVISSGYTRLAVEPYGGMINYTWLDKSLSVAGRVITREGNALTARLVNIDKPIATIPSVAIHLNRTVNDGYKFNPAVDMLPLLTYGDGRDAFWQAVADSAGVAPEAIISHDLYLYNAEEGKAIGLDGELILAPRIDDLSCVYASLEAFINAPETDSAVSVLAIFDNEEVGSHSLQGAASTFLDDTLKCIAGNDEKYRKMLYNSFMVSSDNVHARHPNHPEMADAVNAPVLGGGVAVKYNANKRYATEGCSDAIFRTLADAVGVKLQSYSNRSDQIGGSTLGAISSTQVSITTVDVGIPQLAMHSTTETIAANDLSDMVKILTELYSSGISKNINSIKIVK